MKSDKKIFEKNSREYVLKSCLKVARYSRLVAKLIDLSIVIFLAFSLYPLGVFLAVFYLAISDSIHNGQSLGKKFIGLRVVSLKDGKPCSLKESCIRNLPLILPLINLIIPYWGIFMALILGLISCAFELYLMFKLDSGHRLGDVMADTTVIADDPYREDINKKKSKNLWNEISGALPSL